MSLNPFAAAWVPPTSIQLRPITTPTPIEEELRSEKGQSESSQTQAPLCIKRVPSSLTAAIAASRGSSPALPDQAATSVKAPTLDSPDDATGEMNELKEADIHTDEGGVRNMA
jgi:hypothetical protein